MSALINTFQERKAEVETYMEFLSAIEKHAKNGPPRLEGSKHPITVEQQRILYSTVYLQLYNLVEATISLCIKTVTDSATTGGQWKPGDLSDPLRREWVRAIAKTHENLTPEHRLDHALKLCDHLVSDLAIDAFDIDRGGGGNWDDASIESFCKKLGFQLNVEPSIYSAIKQPVRDQKGALRLIKDLRNELAHGSISFAQCTENVNLSDLKELKQKTFDYLEAVLDCFERYVNGFEYLLPELRPQ